MSTEKQSLAEVAEQTQPNKGVHRLAMENKDIPFPGKPVINTVDNRLFFAYPFAKIDTSAAGWVMYTGEDGNTYVIVSRNTVGINEWMVSTAGFINAHPQGYAASKNEPFVYKQEGKEIVIDYTLAELTAAMKEIYDELVKENNGRYDNIVLDARTVRAKLSKKGINVPKDIDIDYTETLLREAHEELGIELTKENFPKMRMIQLPLNNTISFSSGLGNRAGNICPTFAIHLGKLSKEQEPKLKIGSKLSDAKIVALKDIVLMPRKEMENGQEQDSQYLTTAFYKGEVIVREGQNLKRTGEEKLLPITVHGRHTLEQAVRGFENLTVQKYTTRMLPGNIEVKAEDINQLFGQIKGIEKVSEKDAIYPLMIQSNNDKNNGFRTFIGEDNAGRVPTVKKLAKCFRGGAEVSVEDANQCLMKK
ncbi:MAG: hypothetical protein J0G32_00645 [Alphaproteobacteria bacterium]|nr:hypothetical protein [Alphaproteobacteria bacterium]OJV14249.1 MAG: hypothetical protein BGO27_01970 [Alphaproteobacteria bacterium 33-17]